MKILLVEYITSIHRYCFQNYTSHLGKLVFCISKAQRSMFMV